MTEAEWLACTDPLLLVNAVADKASERKLRLLLFSCCRRLRPLLQDRRLQEGVEKAEEYAEGMRTDEELADTARAANEAVIELGYPGERGVSSLTCAARAVVLACSERGYLGSRIHSFTGRYRKGSYAVMRGVDAAAEAAAHRLNRDHGPVGTFGQLAAAERQGQCLLIRDIIGNPFRPATVERSWLAWNDATVVRLAQAAYDERHMPEGTLDNGRLVVLADALEEAGCTSEEILGHLRGSGPHVRGCFVLDLLLYRE
jgi:hypothetical protein